MEFVQPSKPKTTKEEGKGDGEPERYLVLDVLKDITECGQVVPHIDNLLFSLSVESEVFEDLVRVSLSDRRSRRRRAVESVPSSVLSLEEEVKGGGADKAHLWDEERKERDVRKGRFRTRRDVKEERGTNDREAEGDSVSEEETRRIPRSVNLRSDDSTSVSESESQTHRGGPGGRERETGRSATVGAENRRLKKGTHFL